MHLQHASIACDVQHFMCGFPSQGNNSIQKPTFLCSLLFNCKELCASLTELSTSVITLHSTQSILWSLSIHTLLCSLVTTLKRRKTATPIFRRWSLSIHILLCNLVTTLTRRNPPTPVFQRRSLRSLSIHILLCPLVAPLPRRKALTPIFARKSQAGKQTAEPPLPLPEPPDAVLYSCCS